MGRWRSFSDVLDGLLNEGAGASAAVAGPTSRMASTVAIHVFAPYLKPNRFWTEPGPLSDPNMTPAARFRAPDAYTDQQAAAAQAGEPRRRTVRQEPRQKRALKPAEETALQTLVRLGAGLDRSYTARELRTAFRELAHRYHPDRHPGASDTERGRLGATFAELTSAYGVLQSGVK